MMNKSKYRCTENAQKIRIHVKIHNIDYVCWSTECIQRGSKRAFKSIKLFIVFAPNFNYVQISEARNTENKTMCETRVKKEVLNIGHLVKKDDFVIAMCYCLDCRAIIMILK